MIKQAPYSFGISFLIMILLVWAVFEWRHRKRLEKLEGRLGTGGNSAAVTDSGNSNATGGNATAKVVGDVHFHGMAATPLPPPLREPDDPPIISFEEGQNILLANSGWVWVEHHQGLSTIVAVFRNRIRGVGKPTPIAYRVSAHLTFKSPNKTVHVDHGAWLGEYTYFAEFKPNDVRKLVVVLRDHQNVFCTRRNFCASDPRQGRIRSGITNIHHPAHVPLNEEEEWEVEIVLVEKDTALFSRKFWLRANPNGDGWLLLS